MLLQWNVALSTLSFSSLWVESISLCDTRKKSLTIWSLSLNCGRRFGSKTCLPSHDLMMEMIFWTCTIDKSAAVCSIATSSTGTEAPALAYFAVCLLGSRIYDLRFYASGRILSKTFHNSPIKNLSKIFFGKLQNVSKIFCRKYWCRKFSFENGKMACRKFSVENSNVCRLWCTI